MPHCPEDVEYLVDWAYMLHGRSGVGMGSLAPVSPQTIEAFARLYDLGELHPLEVEALLILDSSMFISDKEPAKDEQRILRVAEPAWPQRKDSA